MSAKLKILTTISLILFGLSITAQNVSLSISNGINFSQIQNNNLLGKWETKPGPINGLLVDFHLGKILSLKTGIEHVSLYYRYKDYHRDLFPYPLYLSSVYPWPSYNYHNNWNLSYLRVPLAIGFQTPARLSLKFAAGTYYAKLLKSDIANYNPEFPDFDYGLYFSHGLSYQVNSNWKIGLELAYYSGKKNIDLRYVEKNGAIELKMGVGYTFSSKKASGFKPKNFSDSIHYRAALKYHAGPLLSKNRGKNSNFYKEGFGFSAGLSMVYAFDKNTGIQTGIHFVRKEYMLKDSSSMDYYYLPGTTNAWVETQTLFDYFEIPLIYNVSAGKRMKVYGGAGVAAAIKLNARVTGFAISRYQNESIVQIRKKDVFDHINGHIKDNDFSWLVNAGLQIPFKEKFRFDFNLSYQESFNNIHLNDDKNDIRLSLLALKIGLIIPLI
jgi:opacity protein-like surface antigen